ncbi:MAG: hypothetical protein ACOYM9_26320, partial [Bradymonadia bacterium]
ERMPDLGFSWVDHNTGRTVQVALPLWKDDNWNLGGYFTVDRNGRRIDIDAWSPAAAHGTRGREVAEGLWRSGAIDPRQVKVSGNATHQLQFGGDGGQYWIPTSRQTREDGAALFRAKQAAVIPTDSSRTLRPDDNAQFAQGYREAEFGNNVLTGLAVTQTVIGFAGSVNGAISQRGTTTLVNPTTGQTLKARTDPRTGRLEGTIYDQNGRPLASGTSLGRDFERTVDVAGVPTSKPPQPVKEPRAGVPRPSPAVQSPPPQQPNAASSPQVNTPRRSGAPSAAVAKPVRPPATPTAVAEPRQLPRLPQGDTQVPRVSLMSEARAYAETQPNNKMFSYADHPGSPEGDDAVYFRGGREVQPGVTPSASVDTSQPPGADSNSAANVGSGGGDVVAGPTDAGNGVGLPPTGNGPGAAGSSGRGDADPRVAMGTRVNRASIRTVEAANVSDALSVARGADGRVEPVQFILRAPVPRSDRFTERLVTITSGDRLTDAEVTQLRASVISGNTHTYNARHYAQIDTDLRRSEVIVTVQNLEARPGGAEGELTVTGGAAQASVRRNPAQPGVAETSYVQLVVSGEGTTGTRMKNLPPGASSLYPDRGTPQIRYGVPGGASQAAEILVSAMDQLGMPPAAFYNTRPGERSPDPRVAELYVGIKRESLVTFPGLLPGLRIRHYVLERNPDGSWPEGYRPPNPETGERALWAGQEVIPPPSSLPIEEGGVPIRPGLQLPPASDEPPGGQNVPGDGSGTPGADGGAGTDPNGSGW